MKKPVLDKQIWTRGSERGNVGCECTKDVILPDMYNDIKRILRSDVSLRPGNTSVDNSKFSWDATLFCSILFVDENDEIKNVDVIIDCSGGCQLDQDNSRISFVALPYLESFSVKAVNPRKLGVRARVGVNMKSWAGQLPDPELPDFFNEDDRLSVETRKCECRHMVMVCAEERDVTVNEDIILDKLLPSVGEMLSCSVTIGPLDLRSGEDAVAYSGEAKVGLVYLSDEKKLTVTERKVNISGTVDAQGVSPDAVLLATAFVGKHECQTSEDMSGQNRIVSVDFCYDVFVSAACPVSADYVTDLYSTDFRTENNLQIYKCSTEAKNEELSVKRNCSSPFDGSGEILSVSAVSAVTSFARKDDGVYAFVSSALTALVRKEDGTVTSVGILDGFDIRIPDCREQLANIVICKTESGTAEGNLYINYEAKLSLLCWDDMQIEAVGKVRAGEADRIVQGRPLTVYYPAPGETLWQIAKRYSVTEQTLEAANHTRENGDALIIPRRRVGEGA